MFDTPEALLPLYIQEKSVSSSREFGVVSSDVLEVIAAAAASGLAVIGGQVQYQLPNATSELYWLSYNSSERLSGESWVVYCNRSAFECSAKFTRLICEVNIEMDAVSSFPTLRNAFDQGTLISQYQVFILYFAAETD